MGAEIGADYEGRNPLIVAVLRGAVVFTADLMRAIHCQLGVDFMAVSSYGDGTKSSGVVRIVKDLDTRIEGRDVLIVEDILDSGLTLSYLMKKPLSLVSLARWKWPRFSLRTFPVRLRLCIHATLVLMCPMLLLLDMAWTLQSAIVICPILGYLNPRCIANCQRKTVAANATARSIFS